MDEVSIILSTRQCTGKNEIEIVGECEEQYNALALYSFSIGVIQKAKSCEGEMIPWNREPEFQKFCYAFRFKTEEKKREFLHKLFSSC